MSPQVQVSYFGLQKAALGHSILYLTGAGKSHLPGSPYIHPSMLTA